MKNNKKHSKGKRTYKMTRVKPIATDREDILDLVHLLQDPVDQTFLRAFIEKAFICKTHEALAPEILVYRVMLGLILKKRSVKKRTALVRIFTEEMKEREWTHRREEAKLMNSSTK